jgi:hypothetical protein
MLAWCSALIVVALPLLSFVACAYDVSDPAADHTTAAIEFDEVGDMKAAVASFRAATRFQPSKVEHWNNLATALREPDQLTDGMEQEAEACELKATSLLGAQFDKAKDMGIDVLNPGKLDGVSWFDIHKISSGTYASDSGCCATSYATVWDEDKEVIAAVIDNFLCDPEAVREVGLNSGWYEAARDGQGDTSNAFPGNRKPVPRDIHSMVQSCLKPVAEALWPEFAFSAMISSHSIFGLTDKPMETLRSSQRLPHNDINWNFGLHEPDEERGLLPGEIPKGLASVFGLTKEYDNTGTTFYREKTSKLSLLRTAQMNQDMWGEVTATSKRLNASGEVKWGAGNDEFFANGIDGFGDIDNHWVEGTVISRLRYNRFLLYDMRRLHNVYFNQSEYHRITSDAAKGRLTTNSFFWMGGGAWEHCVLLSSEGCQACTQGGCGWCAHRDPSVGQKCLPMQGGLHVCDAKWIPPRMSDRCPHDEDDEEEQKKKKKKRKKRKKRKAAGKEEL